MPFYLFDGMPIIVDGQLAFDESCCCDEEATACCDLGTTVTGTLSAKTGVATAMPATVTMTETAVASLTWNSNTFAHPCPADGVTAGMTLRCAAGEWTLVGSGFLTFSAVLVSSDCDTLTVVFDVSITTSCGPGTFRITFQG